jgi:hypothetical protein
MCSHVFFMCEEDTCFALSTNQPTRQHQHQQRQPSQDEDTCFALSEVSQLDSHGLRRGHGRAVTLCQADRSGEQSEQMEPAGCRLNSIAGLSAPGPVTRRRRHALEGPGRRRSGVRTRATARATARGSSTGSSCRARQPGADAGPASAADRSPCARPGVAGVCCIGAGGLSSLSLLGQPGCEGPPDDPAGLPSRPVHSRGLGRAGSGSGGAACVRVAARPSRSCPARPAGRALPPGRDSDAVT